MTSSSGTKLPWETYPVEGGLDGPMVIRPATVRRVVAGQMLYLLPLLLCWVVILAWFPEVNGWLSRVPYVMLGLVAGDFASASSISGLWSLISADHMAGSSLGWGKKEPGTRMVMHEDVDTITVRQSVIERLAGIGTIDIDCREGRGPKPEPTLRWRTPHSFSIIYVHRPHAVARRIWERVSARNEAIDRPGPPATLHL